MFNDFKGNSFKSIHIQHKNNPNKQHSTNNSSDTINCRAFITLENGNFLILYSLKDKRWRKVNLLSSVKIIPQAITIRNDEDILITDITNHLWKGNIRRMKMYRKETKIQRIFIKLDQLGSLLGDSKSLVSSLDSFNGELYNDFLYYYMPRDGVVVRWDLR